MHTDKMMAEMKNPNTSKKVRRSRPAPLDSSDFQFGGSFETNNI
jgi:hypothetical protein